MRKIEVFDNCCFQAAKDVEAEDKDVEAEDKECSHHRKADIEIIVAVAYFMTSG